MTAPTDSTPERATPVGIGALVVLAGADDALVSQPLGAGVGVTLFDPVTGVGGLAHFILPQPPDGVVVAPERVGTYANTALPELFRRAYELGAHKADMIVCAAGGAKLLGDEGALQLGPRGRTLMRKLFWTNGVRLAAEDFGGTGVRRLRLDLADGRVTVGCRGEERELWRP